MSQRPIALWLIALVLAACNLNEPTPEATETALPTLPALTATPSVTVTASIEATILPTTIPVATLPSPGPTPQTPFPETFPDRHEVSARAGQTIVVTYDIVVDNPGRGQVFLVARDPSGETIWQQVFTESETASVELDASMSGTYEILAAIRNLEGRYSVSYSTR